LYSPGPGTTLFPIDVLPHSSFPNLHPLYSNTVTFDKSYEPGPGTFVVVLESSSHLSFGMTPNLCPKNPLES
jgi:hypothetical protein